jgi:hypothetical protein
MFHRTTSQGSEVMNAANTVMRATIAVCPSKDGMPSLQNAANERMGARE